MTPFRGSWSALGILAASFLPLVLAACGAPPTPTPEPPPDPRALLGQAAERLVALRTVAFDLQHQEGSTQLFPGVEMTRAFGETEIGTGFRFTVEARLGSSYFETHAVVLDGRTYMTNFLTGNWEEVAPGSLPFNFTDVGRSLALVLEDVRDPELVGEEPIDGRDAYRIRGNSWSQDLRVLVPNAGEGHDVALELWVDLDTGALVYATLTGPLVDTDVPEVVRTLSLTALDQPVEIAIPPGLEQ